MKKRLIVLIILIIFIFLGTFLYLNDYYKSYQVDEYLKSNDLISIKKIDNGYFFDGEGKDHALILYPGAKVEYTSYAPLMYKLASNGVDCFLIEMPFNIAFFNPNAADSIIDNYKYNNWFIGGHSLGGVVASSYANKNDKIEGIIFLASYSTKPLNDNLRILSIYGDLDGVLNKKSYNKSKKNWNDNYIEYVIEGGNHAGFASYGNQKKDNKATITNEEQQNITVEKIIDFINK